ncbi:sodium:solute symporter [Paucibacter sp. PLA-PC-4]|uniref:sodium:solute symporter n=1 Tax=Paucibacter sp. PLA-PC-4 TaxID=2993655 RepID=UPI0022489EB7|nr:sodium:solute symporter [Paucibacter sp. PLA-PC-4]MCX2861279.1 sodium:solute symporter [Paucibacter sp. PLA-PC-4]
MSPLILLFFVLAYFALLLGVAWWTSRRADNQSFFIGNRNSNWMLVAFGMVGTSLSGVTFISVPGAVGATAFSYFQIVLGQFIGYAVIAFVLLPLYYRLQLTSIYDYLGQRLGPRSYRTGAGFFILSRTLGATARLYLVVKILQDAILERIGLPFWLTALVILLMILAYTYEGGVKTIVWTDTLQTTCMLGGLIVCVAYLLRSLDMSLAQSLASMDASGLSRVFETDPNSRFFFGKQILAGAFIAIAMTGMDQEMMQKNISVKRLADSQKNVMVLATIMLGVVLLFLFLGGLLHLFAAQAGLAAQGDALFAAVVLNHLPAWVQLVFVIALISALFPSADGAITALTSSFCIDLLNLQRRGDWSEAKRLVVRKRVHLGFAALFLLLVMVFKWVNNPSMIGLILKLAGYTYGPLLGLFAFGILTRRSVRDRWVPMVAVAAPLLSWLLDSQQRALFGSYELGLELLLINGALTFAGLWLLSHAASRASNSARQRSA